MPPRRCRLRLRLRHGSLSLLQRGYIHVVRRLALVKILLAHEFVGIQLLVPVDIEFLLLKVSPGLSHIGRRRFLRRNKAVYVGLAGRDRRTLGCHGRCRLHVFERRQHLACFDVVAFFRVQVCDTPECCCSDIDVCFWLNLARPTHNRGQVFTPDLGRRHWRDRAPVVQ